MAKGRLLLLQIGQGTSPEVYETVAALRSKSLRIGNEAIDTTNSESWDYREFKDGGYGTRTCSLSAAGLFISGPWQKIIEAAAYNLSILILRLLFENGDYIEGSFRITNFSYTGSISDAQSFSTSIENAGDFWLVRYQPPVPPVPQPDWDLTTQYSYISETANTSNMFGRHLAMSGDGNYIITSDPIGYFDANDQGVVTIHARDMSGWSQQALLNPGDLPNNQANYSTCVAINATGDIAVAGYYLPGLPTWRVYVWTRSGAVWTKAQRINRPVTDSSFAWFLALSDDGHTLIIGSPVPSVGTYADNGRVYIYDYAAGSWNYTTYLTAPVAGNWKTGYGLALSNDGLIIAAAAPDWDTPSTNCGGVMIWERVAGTWTYRTLVQADDPVAADFFGSGELSGTDYLDFGRTLALSQNGNYLIAGCPHKDSHVGAAYIFKRSGNDWIQQAKLVGSLADSAYDRFGNSVAFDQNANYAFIGSIGETTLGGTYLTPAGIAYIYQRSGESWAQLRTLYPSTLGANDFYGATVAASHSGKCVVAAYNKNNGAGGNGIGYVFESALV